MTGLPLRRRDLLRLLAYGSAGAILEGCSGDDRRTASTTSPSNSSPTVGAAGGAWNRRRPDRDGPLLVVIELAGGNDGLSMLAPVEDGVYHDRRPTLALDGAAVDDLGGGWGLHRGLAPLRRWPLAFLQGVGAAHPDLSHFEMTRRWALASPDGDTSIDTGVLGRICDAARRDEKVSGISLSFGTPMILRAAEATTVGLESLEGLTLDTDPVVSRHLASALGAMAAGSAEDELGRVARNLRSTRLVYELVAQLAPASSGYPDTTFGHRMAAASRLARSSAGLRVLHVPVDGMIYDTHQDHGPRYGPLMEELGACLSPFLADLDRAGLGDDVVVATISEFGRRLEEHGGGLDHGAASTMMLLGAVAEGIHGEPSSLSRLDGDGNLVATVGFDRYLATLAGWAGADPGRVLAGSADARPIDGVLTA